MMVLQSCQIYSRSLKWPLAPIPILPPIPILIPILILILTLIPPSLNAQTPLPDNPSVDELLELAASSSDTLDADLLYAEARKWYARDSKVTYTLMQASQHLSERLAYPAGQLNAYRGLAALNAFSSRIDSALYYVEQGMKILPLIPNAQEEKINLLINKGSAYTQGDQVTNAISANLEAYQIASEHGFPAKASLVLNNMGILYRKQERYVEALDAYQKSLAVKRQLQDSLGQANTYFNIGAVYAKIDSLPQAIEAIQQAKQHYLVLQQLTSISECDQALGHAYFDTEEFAKAYDLLAPLERIDELTFTQDKVYILHLLLAELALKREEYAEANRLLGDIKGITTSESEEEKSVYYKLRSTLAEKRGQPKEALEMYQLHIAHQQALQTRENSRYRETLVQQFQAREKDLEIRNLNEVNQAQGQALSVRNTALTWGSIALLLMAILLYALYSLYQKNRKNRQQLYEQNVKISEALDQNELLLREIHHRVKNNLQVITSLLSIQERKMVNTDTRDALRSSKFRIQSMSILHKILYQGDDLKEVAASEYLRELAHHVLDSFQPDAEISLQVNAAPLSLDVDTLVSLGLISNELMTNALKHAFSGRTKGHIQLDFHKQEGNLILSVSDDGVGFSGTDFPTQQGSLGTRLIHAFTKRLDGQLTIDQAPGTRVEIVFPLPETLAEVE
ncbi:MAG: histidine kinase dimerization/phosphoacceptor domain -containing protein [Bacteroidota bacterium]